jgi:Domain of unknown function (DUF4262)
MCEMCDDPTLTKADALARMAWRVYEYGWAVQGVERERDRPPWAYTVGLTLHDLPELLITGLPLRRSAELLNGMAAHLLHDRDARSVYPDDRSAGCAHEAPTPGERTRLADGPLVEWVAVQHPDVHLLTAMALFGPTVRGLQMVWADDRDQWPWERGFRGRRGGQPVLGPRKARGSAHLASERSCAPPSPQIAPVTTRSPSRASG